VQEIETVRVEHPKTWMLGDDGSCECFEEAHYRPSVRDRVYIALEYMGYDNAHGVAERTARKLCKALISGPITAFVRIGARTW
jgi:hypothetical protein